MNRTFNVYMDKEGEGAGGGGTPRNYETEAADMGWVPQERWTGKPDKWTDAKTFVERGEKVLPIVLQQNRELVTENKALKQTVAQIQTDVKDFRKMLENTAKKEKETLVAQYEDALKLRKEAVTAGDGDAFDAADAEAKRLERAAQDAERQEKEHKDKQTTASAPQPHPDFAAWYERNKWYNADTHPDVFDEATSVAQLLIIKAQRKGETVPVGKSLFEAVEKEMKRRYPELKDNGERMERGGDVEHDTTPSRQTQTRSGSGKAKTYDNLPSEAKAACDRYIANGMITDRDGKTQAEKRAKYCENYDWD